MAGVSKFDRDPEARELVHSLFAKGFTIDEVVAEFKELGAYYDPETGEGFARSVIGRERQKWAQVMARNEEAIRYADAWAASLDTADGDKLDLAALHMGRVLMVKVLEAQLGQEEIKIKPDQAMFLIKAVQQLGAAQKVKIEAQAAARKEREAEAREVEAPAAGQGGTIELRIVQGPGKPAAVTEALAEDQ